MQPVGRHERGIGAEQARDLVLVGLELVERPFEGGVLVAWILQFHDGQWKTVDEQSNVWPAIVVMLDHCELIHREPVVGIDFSEVDQASEITTDCPVLSGDLDRHSFDQIAVQASILLDERGRLRLLHLAQHLLERLGRQIRVEAFKRLSQAPGQDNLAIADALGRRSVRSDVRSVNDGIAETGEPFESGVLDVGFREFHAIVSTAFSASRRRISPDRSFGSRKSWVRARVSNS